MHDASLIILGDATVILGWSGTHERGERDEERKRDIPIIF
jgi:hypothetical protein